MSDDAELTVSRTKLESFLPVLGLEVTEQEYIRDIETGEIITTEDGTELTIDELGYIGVNDNNEPVLVEDNFPEIVEHLSDTR
jgi:hypothetical protein